MSIGTVVAARVGKKVQGAVYIRIKNGSVYRYPKLLNEEQQQVLVRKMEQAGRRVQLKNWIRVRDPQGNLIRH